MKIIDYLKQYNLGENELWRYVAVFGVLLISLIIGRIIRLIFEKRGETLRERPRMQLVGLVLGYLSKPVVLFTFSIGFSLSMLLLKITPGLQPVVSLSVRLLFSVSFGYILYNLVDLADYYLTRWSARTDNKIDDMLVPLVRKSLRITIVVVVIVYIAESVSGKTVGTLIAGLGIGGLAVALAAQDTLKNFFASVVLMIDQPFHMGDWVVIDGSQGVIEEVGFRSTKIRTFEGHLIVMPNSNVANITVDNVGRRPYIRRWANITVTYDTPPAKVQEALDIMRDIMERNKAKFHPDFPYRLGFTEFNDASLNLILVYYFTPPVYWDFQAFNHEVNMEILERFNAAGIDFAFPTQTIHLANDEKRQLAVKMLETR